MIQLTNLLWAINVPNEYHKFKISGTNYLCGKINDIWEPLPPRLDGNYNIVGTVSSEGEIDFDCENWVNKFGGHYYEYLAPGMMRVSSMKHAYPFLSKDESFISLLQSKGIAIKKLNDEKILILEKYESSSS